LIINLKQPKTTAPAPSCGHLQLHLEDRRMHSPSQILFCGPLESPKKIILDGLEQMALSILGGPAESRFIWIIRALYLADISRPQHSV
jgi:hypothetical protein